MRYRKALLFIFTILFSVHSYCQHNDRLNRLVEHLDSLVANGDTPSYVLGVFENGKRQFFSGGLAVVEDSIPADSLTVYEIGSISKTFTTLLTQQLINQNLNTRNELSWDTSVSQFLPPSSKLPDTVRLHHLATHTSGLHRMPKNFTPSNNEDPYADYSDASLDAFLEKASGVTPDTNIPQYSNLGLGLLGRAISVATQKPYAHLLKDHIFKPLSLNSAGLERAYDDLIMAQGYVGSKPVSRWSFDALSSAGAIDMNMVDLLTYLSAYLDESSAIYDAGQTITAPQVVTGRRFVGYGWFGINREDDSDLIFHNGGTGGYKSSAGIDMENQLAFALLTNGKHELDPMLAYFFGLADELPPITPVAKLTEKEMMNYVGSYKVSPNFMITISLDGGQLFAQANNQNPLPIYPLDKTSFEFRDVKAKLVFDLDSSGNTNGVTLFQNNFKQRGEKVD